MEESHDGFDSKFLDAFAFAARSVGTFQHFALARYLAKLMPTSLTKALSPESGGLLEIAEVYLSPFTLPFVTVFST